MTESVKLQPALKKRNLSSKQKLLPNFALGADGESQAIVFLKNKKWSILATNVRFKNHELDIVALDSEADEIVFVEVKTRTHEDFGDPSSAVNYTKLKSMQIAAQAYCRERHLDNDYRFDIISILPNRIEHFENVTWNRH